MTVQGIATTDFSSLNELKARSIKDAKGALPEVAKQFEAIFLQSMLKSMRMGEHFLDESSPLRGKNQETFQDMLDGQYATTIANGKGIGFASMLAKQLESVAGAESPEAVASPARAIMPAFQLMEPKQMTEVAKDKPVTTIDEFVQSIWPKAKAAASAIGLDPKILMAQAALETGWGKFVAKDTDGTSSNNLFNIKASENSQYDSVKIKTTEYIADTPIKMNASFRKYPSVEHSFNDYVSLIKGDERYQGALASAGNPENYVNELHKAGYATDPEYGTKILSIYHGDELNQAMRRCGLSAQV